jgi:thiamine-monophosphate kinase
MNEFELIAMLTKNSPKKAQGLSLGIGDDCAVIEGDGFDWLVTTDALFEKVHFDLDHTTATLLGRKALSVNLSDVAAMGGTPLFYTVSLGVPPNFPVTHLQELYLGMEDVGKEAGVNLIGGDTCASASGLVISITVIGKMQKGKAILRSTAKKDDAIYVTGTFGEAALGLELLKKGMTDEKYYQYVKRHNDPKARLGMGSFFAGTGMATSMIDVSDGLLADLGHIADSSSAGFELDAHAIPFSKGFADVAAELGLDPMALALTGGEDYELILTIDSKRTGDFEKLMENVKFRSVYPVTKIGIIVGDATKRLVLNKNKVPLRFERAGYDHFSR